MTGHVYISYARPDCDVAKRIFQTLQSIGLDCWMDSVSIAAGTEWNRSIADAIQSSRVFVLVYSEAAVRSEFVNHEVEVAQKHGVPVVSVQIEDVEGRSAGVDAIDARAKSSAWVDKLIQRIREILPVEAGVAPSPASIPAVRKNKGYVFISYVRSDRAFVERFKDFLKLRGYYYWDYFESERNYHGALYRELEERIEDAAAFMCVVSDAWRDTEWTAAEYIYAKDARIPVFVIQSQPLSRPFPIILNQQTRIDMSTDFSRGVRLLGQELDKAGL